MKTKGIILSVVVALCFSFSSFGATASDAREGLLVPVPSKYGVVYHGSGMGEPTIGRMESGFLRLSVSQAADGVNLYYRQLEKFSSLYGADYAKIKEAIKSVEKVKPAVLDASDAKRILEQYEAEMKGLEERLKSLDAVLRNRTTLKDGRIHVRVVEPDSIENGLKRLAELLGIRKEFKGEYAAFTRSLEQTLGKVKAGTVTPKDSSALEKSGEELWATQANLVKFHNHFIGELDKYIASCRSYMDQKVKVYTKWDEVESRTVALKSPAKITAVDYTIVGLPSMKYPTLKLVQKASTERKVLLPSTGYLSRHFPQAALKVISVECTPLKKDNTFLLSKLGRSVTVKRQEGAVSLPFKVLAMPQPFVGKSLQGALDSSGLQFVANRQSYPLRGLAASKAMVLPGAKLKEPKGFSVSGDLSLPYPSCQLPRPTKGFTLVPEKALWIVLVAGQMEHIRITQSLDFLDQFAWEYVVPMIEKLNLPSSVPVTLSFVRNILQGGHDAKPVVTHVWQRMALGGKTLSEPLGEVQMSDWVCDYQVSPERMAGALRKVAASSHKDTDLTVLVLSYPGGMSTGAMKSLGRNADLHVIDITKIPQRGGVSVKSFTELKAVMIKTIEGM